MTLLAFLYLFTFLTLVGWFVVSFVREYRHKQRTGRIGRFEKTMSKLFR